MSVESKQEKVKHQGLYDWMQSVVTTFLFIMILLTFVGRTMGVENTSMMPTLHDSDRMIIRSIFYTPAPNDIIVFSTQSFEDGASLVKRVIALAGDTVDIDFDRGIVYRNGLALEEPFVNSQSNLRGDVMFPQVVPEGHVFVLGDNRNSSADSRNSSIGHIDEREIIGRVVALITPINRAQLFLR